MKRGSHMQESTPNGGLHSCVDIDTVYNIYRLRVYKFLVHEYST